MPRNEIEILDTRQSVELGEGVEIHLRIAGPFPRALALLLDMLIVGAIMLVLGFILTVVTSGMWMVGQGIFLIVGFFLSWGYFAYFEAGKRGATIGKRTLGLRVIDRSGKNITKGQAFVRNILRLVDMLPGMPSTAAGVMIGSFGLGFFCCLFTKKFQRVGDLVANTLVVYTQPELLMTGQEPSVESSAPTVALAREEQVALVDYYNRASMWSEARRIELSDHASGLTQKDGMAGMIRLLGMAKWIKEKK
ncbi:MAG: RDD family protein [Akkermansiaceae bacterium]